MEKTVDRSFFGHPMGLSTLFATEFWERFSYYGMRAILTLFLTAQLVDGGFGYTDDQALALYGIFTALVYVTPIIGGILADKVLGQRKTIYIGGIAMAIGQFILAYSAMHGNDPTAHHQFMFNLGLAVLILGNGFFKPNISTMVGSLYDANDDRRDGAFTLFYMGINAGAFFAPLVAGALAEGIAWYYGFLSAGVGMLIGTLWFYFRAETLGNVGLPPKAPKEALRIAASDWKDIILYVAGTVLLAIGVMLGWAALPEIGQDILVYTVGGGGILYLLFTVFKNTEGKTEWSRVGVIFLLTIFNIVFWSGFEQAGGTFNLFARDMTERSLFGMEIPASAFQAINAIAIFIFAPVFTVIWDKLSRAKANPRTPVKFAIGLFLLSAGFFVMALADEATGGGLNKVSPLWLVMVYLLHTWGELCLSPIGLSMITKLSPPKIVSVMMGLWMGSIALGNFLAASMKSIVENFDIPLFYFIGAEAAIAGVILLVLSPFMIKMMKGIH
ncbi:peptide MFS transporter [Persicobacter diffluens]